MGGEETVHRDVSYFPPEADQPLAETHLTYFSVIS